MSKVVTKMIYLFFIVILFLIELGYFKIADKYDIIDKPNHRSSHTRITIRGGGIIFPISIIIWFVYSGFQYPFFVIGLLIISTVSFLDDIKEFSKRWRLLAHLFAVLLVIIQFNLLALNGLLITVIFIFFIGIINAYNFMDGINGITGVYSFVCLLTLLWINKYQISFIENSLLWVTAIAVMVFNFFNFRIKATCFAGDVGSISIAFIICFFLLKLILQTQDVRYILLLAVYGVDSVFTIIIRLLKKENIFLPHRSHLYQLLANEHKYNHLLIAGMYGFVQLLINITIINSFKWGSCLVLVTYIFVLGVIYLILRLNLSKKQLSKTVNV